MPLALVHLQTYRSDGGVNVVVETPRDAQLNGALHPPQHRR